MKMGLLLAFTQINTVQSIIFFLSAGEIAVCGNFSGCTNGTKSSWPPLAGFLFSPLRLTVCMGRDVEGLPA